MRTIFFYVMLIGIFQGIGLCAEGGPRELLHKEGYGLLIHRTRPENLISILRDGRLYAGEKKGGCLHGDPMGNHRRVFLSLWNEEKGKEDLLHFVGNHWPVLMIEGKGTLDEKRFHLSLGYPCGRFLGGGLSADFLDRGGLQALCRHADFSEGHELVFSESVSLNGLVAIFLKRGTKTEFLEALKQEGIEAPLGSSWEELLQEVDVLFQRTEEQLPHLYSGSSLDILRYAYRKQGVFSSNFLRSLKGEYRKSRKKNLAFKGYWPHARMHSLWSLMQIAGEFDSFFDLLSCLEE